MKGPNPPVTGALSGVGLVSSPQPAPGGKGLTLVSQSAVTAVGIADDKGGLPWNESPPSVAGPVYGPTEER